MLLTDPKKRSFVFQSLLLALVVFAGYWLFQNTQANLAKRDIATGFGFLNQEAAFDISETTWLDFTPEDTYLKAFAVGVLNTLKVSVIGIVFSILLGTLLGIARLSSNWLVNKVSSAIIEGLRNTPLLLQLFFWYVVLTESLPHPRRAWEMLPHVFLSNRGLYFPGLQKAPEHTILWIVFILSFVAVIVFKHFAKKKQEQTGKLVPVFWTSLAIFLFPLLLASAFTGFPFAFDLPQLKGFNFRGGHSVTPEFFALLLGLVLYTSAFVAETVRAGILSVDKGQTEAAAALGLRPKRILGLIILPQALRVIIPPLTNQMLNLTKNSSLALAIGYTDVVAVANITLNQTGQAIESIALIMAVYLFLSLVTSAFMNWYNKKVALVER